MKLFNKKIFKTMRTLDFSSMSFSKNNLKIFNSIIIFNSIAMMNNFIPNKFSSKMFFHNISMFHHISRTILFQYLNITSIKNSFSSFKTRMFAASFCKMAWSKRCFIWFRKSFCTFIPRIKLWFIKSNSNKMLWMQSFSCFRKSNTQTFFRTIFCFLMTGMKFYFTNITNFIMLFFSIFPITCKRAIFCFSSFSNQSYSKFFLTIRTWFISSHKYSFRFILVIILFFIIDVNNNASCSPPSRIYQYTTGTTIRSSDVAGNENAIFTYLQAGVDTFLDGSIVSADISSGAGIPYSKLSLTGGILNSDVNSSAAIAYSKLNLATSIVNADVSASAAIVDTKLAQITTASKVSGTAITGLASLPSGAGVIPTANLGSGATSANFLRGDQTYAAPGSLSNAIFTWSSNTDLGGTTADGFFTQTTLDVSALGTGNYNFIATNNTSYTTVLRTKFTKTAGVSTLTLHAYIWGDGGGSITDCQLDVNAGAITGSVSGTASATSPEWKTSSGIDVSGLSNGSTYDLLIKLETNATHTAALGAVAVIGS